MICCTRVSHVVDPQSVRQDNLEQYLRSFQLVQEETMRHQVALFCEKSILDKYEQVIHEQMFWVGRIGPQQIRAWNSVYPQLQSVETGKLLVEVFQRWRQEGVEAGAIWAFYAAITMKERGGSTVLAEHLQAMQEWLDREYGINSIATRLKGRLSEIAEKFIFLRNEDFINRSVQEMQIQICVFVIVLIEIVGV